MLIIDTHQHLWDLSWQKLLWLEGAPNVLRRNYLPQDYAEATRGFRVQAIYMEVDVDPKQHLSEAEYVVKLCRQPNPTTRAAVVGGRPSSNAFESYVQTLLESVEVKGIRQVLHGESTPKGYCLDPKFVKGIQVLGEKGLSFDLCMRASELDDACQLTELCPDTRFVVDHCGNADPKVFRTKQTSESKPSHDPDAWRRSIEKLAKRPNTICKISGIIASAPADWKTDDLAPIVNHCLDSFGMDRVVFGGDWPVCLLGAPLQSWLKSLHEIAASRPSEDQKKLWHANAQKFYGLPTA
jgi:predicted TIM-barrel fold metal-dependent hydrolase